MFFVKIENNEVTQCWDTQPPRGESGWKSAIEVRPPLTPNRQYYTGHTFDITKDPVEIVYGVEDMTVEGRKAHFSSTYKFAFQQVVNEEMRKEVDEFPSTQYDAAVVDAARVDFEAKMTALAAITTHDELDAL
jgi:hypothetical protein